jgi:hypothetical protein
MFLWGGSATKVQYSSSTYCAKARWVRERDNDRQLLHTRNRVRLRDDEVCNIESVMSYDVHAGVARTLDTGRLMGARRSLRRIASLHSQQVSDAVPNRSWTSSEIATPPSGGSR